MFPDAAPAAFCHGAPFAPRQNHSATVPRTAGTALPALRGFWGIRTRMFTYLGVVRAGRIIQDHWRLHTTDDAAFTAQLLRAAAFTPAFTPASFAPLYLQPTAFTQPAPRFGQLRLDARCPHAGRMRNLVRTG